MAMAEEESKSKAVVSGDTGGTESRRLCKRLKLPPEKHGGSCGGVESEKVTAEDLLPEECVLCGKRFGSAKALGGHMRVHSQDQGLRSAQLSSIMLNDEKPLECSVCGRTFPSKKSLYGHMRLHPDREWRGIRPPAEEVKPELVIDPRPVIAGWSASGKRGRRSADSVTSGFDSASVKAGSSTQGTMEEEKRGDETGKHPGTEVENEILPEKKHPDDPRVKAEEARGKNSGTGLENKKPKGVTKRKARELEGTNHEHCAKRVANDTSGPASATKYTCNRCHRSFSRFQALGGHRSSCNRTKQSTEGQGVEANMPGMWSGQPRLDLSLSLFTPGPSRSDVGCYNGATDLQPNANEPPSSEESNDNEPNMIEFL